MGNCTAAIASSAPRREWRGRHLPPPPPPQVEGARRLAERNCVGKKIVEAVIADDESELAWEGGHAHERSVAGSAAGYQFATRA